MTATILPGVADTLTPAEVRYAAEAWRAANFAVLPVHNDGTKSPALPAWRDYTGRLPTQQEHDRWFGGNPTGLGLVCGAVSDGLEMFELEGRAIQEGAHERIAAAVEQAGIGDLWRRLLAGFVEESPTGGLHILARIADHATPGNVKIAQRPARSDELTVDERAVLAKRPGKVFTRCLAETRGEGGFVVVAPSHGSTHPTGRPWILADGSEYGVVPAITWEERNALHAVVRMVLDEMPEPEQAGPERRSSTSTSHPSEGERPGDAWARQTTWAEILEAHGWKWVYARGGMDFWRRPGKNIGVSARTGGKYDGLYVWSTSTEFPAEQSITKFRALSILEHQGDDRAAGAELRRKGYGDQTSPAERDRAAIRELMPPAPVAINGTAPTTDPVGPATADDDLPPDHDNQPEPTMLDRLRAALLDSAGLDSIPEPTPLIGDVLFTNSLCWLYGKPGHGKSFVAIDMAGCVGSGEMWQGFVTKQGLVLYLIAEGASGVKWRVRAWEQAMGHVMDGVKFLPVAVQVTNDAAWSAFCELARELGPVLVIIDTQARVTVGMEENGTKDMGVFVDKAERLRVATGATVLVVHHQGRQGEHMRGSTSMDGAATTILKAEKTEHEITLSCDKQKDAEDFEAIKLRLIPTGSSAVLTLTDDAGTAHSGQLAKLPWLKLWWECHESDWVSVTRLVKSEVVAESTFHRKKFDLIRAGLVAQEGDGAQKRYRLTGKPIHD